MCQALVSAAQDSYLRWMWMWMAMGMGWERTVQLAAATMKTQHIHPCSLADFLPYLTLVFDS